MLEHVKLGAITLLAFVATLCSSPPTPSSTCGSPSCSASSAK